MALHAPIGQGSEHSAEDFYPSIPVFEGFGQVMDPALYRPLPQDWVLGLTDVVNSTEAIAVGRYKAVNTAGAAAISAVSNALGHRSFPFVFGGDGASFATSSNDAARAREALAATAVWTQEELGLGLRAAMIPVAAVRAAGWDVSVARFAPSRHVSYAMFAGGGLAWAESAMKGGEFGVAPAAPGSRPDLTGLSCRWAEIPAEQGVILSLLVAPASSAHMPTYRALVEEILELASGPGAARPMRTIPRLRDPLAGLELEARVPRGARGPLWPSRLRLAFHILVGHAVLRLNLPVPGFDPRVYKKDLIENADFRKYDDALRMTLDCTPALADRLEARLEQAEVRGVARFGLHRQGAALMTCFVPSIYEHDHVHFIDGAAGGYTAAARALKAAAT